MKVVIKISDVQQYQMIVDALSEKRERLCELRDDEEFANKYPSLLNVLERESNLLLNALCEVTLSYEE